jgi:hypothetical protein
MNLTDPCPISSLVVGTSTGDVDIARLGSAKFIVVSAVGDNQCAGDIKQCCSSSMPVFRCGFRACRFHYNWCRFQNPVAFIGNACCAVTSLIVGTA